MQAYMKSTLPFHGVTQPEIVRACRALFQRHSLDRFEIWRDTVLALWRGARVREERYAAMGLAGQSRYSDYQDMRALPLYKELIVSGAWWDYVDAIASHRIGTLLHHHPREMKAVLKRWARADDIWLRRAAILAQLGFKVETDVALLHACIEPSLDRPEFFLRKGIGWALREYAKTNPADVARYVHAHRDRLSPLSQREALKHIKPRRAASRPRTR